MDKDGLVALTLEGHQSSLFKKHLSFTDACKYMDAPTMSRAFQLQSVTENFNVAKLKKSWDHRAATIIEGIFGLDYASADEKQIGAPYVLRLLRFFVNKYPIQSFRELVQDRAIDMAVGYSLAAWQKQKGLISHWLPPEIKVLSLILKKFFN